MQATPRFDTRLALQILALASIAALGLFAWEHNRDFNLWDEGYLWYGAQRVALGEVPFRDFACYDPGRYYWSAAVMRLWGDSGLVILRAGAAMFQVVGICFGLFAISRSLNRRYFLYLLLATVVFAMWMYPNYKFYDNAQPLILIGALTFLIERPTSRRYFLVGMCVGLAAVFGRNHGLYGVVGSIGTMIWLGIKRETGPTLFRGFLMWAAGVVVGYLPVILMLLVVPGFPKAFWESIMFYVEYKGTNLPIPVPWPWRVPFQNYERPEQIRRVMVGLLFMAVLAFGVLSLVWVIWRKFKGKPVPAALVACSFLALPYAHYTFSRAGFMHLTQGVYPLLVGCLVIFATYLSKAQWPLAVTLCAGSVWILYLYHVYPNWGGHMNTERVNVEISGSNFTVDPATAANIALLRKLASQYAPGGQSFLAEPVWPGAYALLERRSPMWDIYAILPRSRTFQEREVERVKAAQPRFAIIYDIALDGRDELRFQNLQPLVYQYLQEYFERVPDSPNPMYQIFKAKEDEKK